MKILVAPDKFKGTLSALQVGRAVARGLMHALPAADIEVCPVADGGDGTAETMAEALGGTMVARTVSGPLGEPATAQFALAGSTAVIEMAAASGLRLVCPDELRPLDASTYGTGELLAVVLDEGCTRIIVGIGGSATTDGGAGMAQALGARLLDDEEKPLGRGGGQLCRLGRIDTSGLPDRLPTTNVLVACDVDNPLLGSRGAAGVYARQKGATAAEAERLEECLARFADVVERDLGVDVRDLPGGGAAGGLGAGMVAFCGAALRPGIEIVLEALDFERRLERADVVVTGEGMLDGQTASGKTPMGVARAAKRHGLRVIAVVGRRGPGFEEAMAVGIDEVVALTPDLCEVEEAMTGAAHWLGVAGERIGETLRQGG